MFVEAGRVDRDTTLTADVCIVGAGPAGITIARELAGGGAGSVIVLESGGFEVEPDTQDLYRGRSVGKRYSMEGTRLRALGGSSGHWGGRCRPLDADDFETRDWIPFSGWPFAKDELDPYYERAQAVCELGPYAYDVDSWRDHLPDGVDSFDDENLTTALFQHSPPTHFGEVYRAELDDADLTVYLHANAVMLVADAAGSRVEEVQVATLNGNRFGVRAGTFVLATGGIEVPRLLLASPGAGGQGLGNEHDLVGRFFMEHPSGRLATAVLLDADFDPRLYDAGGVETTDGGAGSPLLGTFAIPPARRAAENLLGFSATLLLAPPPDSRPAAADVGQVAADLAGSSTWAPMAVLVEGEQVPNPESRVTLGPDLDPLGVPRAELNWTFDLVDTASMARSIELLAFEFGRRGLGRLRLDIEDLATSTPRLFGGAHHMGTARMHPDPEYGVVDEDGRVHGVENLYVAGSAAFPTSGYANPTLTIVALALRLADHLPTVAR